MKNFAFSILENQSNYTVSETHFNINFSKSGKENSLYLRSQEKLDPEFTLFELNEYKEFEIDDIHVTVLSEFEQNNLKKFNNSSPFHITVVLKKQHSDDKIVIHDFYYSLDLSRDFHIQLHSINEQQEETLIYLSKEILDLKQLDKLITKETLLVKNLIEKNNQHEQALLKSIESLENSLYTLAAQSNNFPELMDKNDYEVFMISLNQIIQALEELVLLGHHNEKQKLNNFKSELIRWNSVINIPPSNSKQLSEPEQTHTQEANKNASKNKSNSKTKSQSKSNTSSSHKKTKINLSHEVMTQYNHFLNDYYHSTQILLTQKTNFLQQLDQLLENEFDAQTFLELCKNNPSLFETLSFNETEERVVKFFGQFIIANSLENQILCKETASFLSSTLPQFQRHLLKVSMALYPVFNCQVSGLVFAYLAKNMTYWEYMHENGICFSDNRHILYAGNGGNILHALFILVKFAPTQHSVENLVPFTQRLLTYLKEDMRSLCNLKPVIAVLNAERKRVSAKSFFTKDKKTSPTTTKEDFRLFEKFNQSLSLEPYGTTMVMDVIEAWLTRLWKNHFQGIATEVREIELMPVLVDLFITVAPHISTESLLKSFERLLSLQHLGLFDDLSCHKLISGSNEPAIHLLSDFKMKYVQSEFEVEINRLLQFFIIALNARAQIVSNTTISNHLESYFQQSKNYLPENNSRHSSEQTNHSQTAESLIHKNRQLTLARMAYFLFSIKVKQGMHLTLIDYRAMLHFYRCYLATEMDRFNRDHPLFNHQLTVCVKLMEVSAAAIHRLEIEPDLKNELVQSSEYLDLLAAFDHLKREQDENQRAEDDSSLRSERQHFFKSII